jgi:hypothetical protein
MGMVGGYTLDLYCDGGDECPYKYNEPIQFYDDTFTQCVAKARRYGWFIDRKGEGRECGRALCPSCKIRMGTVKK